MATEILSSYKVHLHRRGGGSETRGHVTVQASSPVHAMGVAVTQTIEVSFPKSKPADWVVDWVEVTKV